MVVRFDPATVTVVSGITSFDLSESPHAKRTTTPESTIIETTPSNAASRRCFSSMFPTSIGMIKTPLELRCAEFREQFQTIYRTVLENPANEGTIIPSLSGQRINWFTHLIDNLLAEGL